MPPNRPVSRNNNGDVVYPVYGKPIRPKDNVTGPLLGPKHPAIRYAFAVVTAALVTELTFELSALIGSRPSPQFLLAILIVAWIAGFGPAVVTWALSVVAINYLFVPPPYTVSFLVKEELVGLPIFSAVALVMAWLAATRRSVETARKALLAREQGARTEAERLAQSLEQAQRITEAPFREISADSLMRVLLARVRSTLGADTATILLLTEDAAHLIPVSSDGLREAVVENLRIPLGRGVAGRIAASETAMIFPDLTNLEVLSPFLRDRVKSLMGTPLRVGDRLTGVIHVGTSTPYQFTQNDQHLLGLVADRVALVIELVRLYEAERAARAQAQSAGEAKDQFLAMLSHELRTPLTSIVGWVRMLRMRSDEPAIVAQATDVIERNAALQIRLVNDLLDVSRIVAGKLALERCAVNLDDVVRAAVDVVRPAAETKRISIDLILDATGSVDGDGTRLQQIVDNLLTNAIKFTPENGRITLRVDRTVSEAVITVADTGRGISADFLPHIFEAFRQADTPPTRGVGSGLGLGLAIVRRLVELHGGTVHAESGGQGQGAHFTVRLPAAKDGQPGLKVRP